MTYRLFERRVRPNGDDDVVRYDPMTPGEISKITNERAEKLRAAGYSLRDRQWSGFSACLPSSSGGRFYVHAYSESDQLPSAPGYASLFEGTYTVVREDRTHETYRVRQQPADAEFAPGETLFYVFVGTDNTDDASYKSLGIIKSDARVVVWPKDRARYGSAASDVAVLLGAPGAAARAYGLASGHCAVCGRLLTNPHSLSVGIGPVCADRTGY